MKFSELQQLLEENFGIDHLADIARELDVSPQAVSNWKARDRVPYKYVVKIREHIERDNSISDKKSDDIMVNDQTILHPNAYGQIVNDDSISLMDLMLALVKQIKIILIIPAVFCSIMIIKVQFFTSPVFISTSKIMSSKSTNNPISLASGLAAQFGVSLPTTQSDPQWVYSDIIKSRTLARRMLKRKFNTEKLGVQKTLLEILTNSERSIEHEKDTLDIFAVKTFIDMVQISEDRKSGIFTLTVSGPEPQFVADLSNVLIEELDAYQREYNNAKVSETRQFIESRIIETKKELTKAEEDLKYFREHNRRIENSAALQLEQQRLQREAAVLTGVFTTLKQQLETTKIEEVRESDYVIIFDPPEPPLYRSAPKKKKMVIFTGFLGIGLGMIIGLGREYIKILGKEDKEKINQFKYWIYKNFAELIPGKRWRFK
jgi:uncharacterized protein involved in exopolysaccharide biosynthesis